MQFIIGLLFTLGLFGFIVYESCCIISTIREKKNQNKEKEDLKSNDRNSTR